MSREQGAESREQEIARNVEILKRRVHQAADRVGRNPDEIEIVAVTKQVDIPRIRQAIDLGLTDLGENRAQEFLQKVKTLSDTERVRKISWHFIGHLQTNKVKQIIKYTHLIQSVESMNLAREIDKRAAQAGKIQSILVEVNASGDTDKYGISPSDVLSFIQQLYECGHLKVEGLMTMAPFVSQKEMLKKVFGTVRELFDRLKQQNPEIPLKYLSMGMTNDFEVAIEEGSNMIRVGTAIFGRRESN